MEAVHADSLTKSYGGVRVLDAATMAVAEGERVVISGTTGAGKTTLLYIIAGLVRPDEGRVRLFGEKASGNGFFMPPEARSIGMVFQRAILWPHMTARGNVEFALQQTTPARSERKSRALEALALFGVEDLAARRPDSLSGGQAQRVALARSIAARPRILLWDEPFTGLDEGTRREIAGRALGFMGSAKVTLVAVSHQREDAVLLGARCMTLEDGKLEDAR
jgi:iron(III) transport system ATP-binding protein